MEAFIGAFAGAMIAVPITALLMAFVFKPHKSFEVKQQILQADVDHLSRQVAELQQLIARRHSSREQVIKARLTEVADKSDHLAW